MIGSVPQKLREWVCRHEADARTGQGISTVEHECVKALDRENKNRAGPTQF